MTLLIRVTACFIHDSSLVRIQIQHSSKVMRTWWICTFYLHWLKRKAPNIKVPKKILISWQNYNYLDTSQGQFSRDIESETIVREDFTFLVVKAPILCRAYFLLWLNLDCSCKLQQKNNFWDACELGSSLISWVPKS